MNTSPQPFQLWPSWHCIKDTSKVGRELPLQHKQIYKIPEKSSYLQKQKAKRIHSFFSSSWSSTQQTSVRGPRPNVGLEPSLPIIPVYWKMIQLLLSCYISGVLPKPDQFPPTCKDTTAIPLPLPGREGKGAQSAGCCGYSHASFPCLGLQVFCKGCLFGFGFF